MIIFRGLLWFFYEPEQLLIQPFLIFLLTKVPPLDTYEPNMFVSNTPAPPSAWNAPARYRWKALKSLPPVQGWHLYPAPNFPCKTEETPPPIHSPPSRAGKPYSLPRLHMRQKYHICKYRPHKQDKYSDAPAKNPGFDNLLTYQTLCGHASGVHRLWYENQKNHFCLYFP